MNRTPSSGYGATIAALLVFASLPSCIVEDKASSEEDSGAAECRPQITSISDDFSIPIGNQATIAVSGDLCEAGTKNFAWAIVSVPVDSAIDTTDLDLSNPAAPSFLPDKVGDYAVSAVLADAAGNLSTVEYVVVTVTASGGAPIPDCGENVTAEVNQRVDLDGTASHDPEGRELTYAWALSSAPTCSDLVPGAGSVYNGTSSTASVVPDCAGTFVVALAVSDGEQWSDADYCSITVASGNEPPVADAGASGSLSPCTNRHYELDGYGSYDPEGAPITYWWTLLAAPTGSTSTDESFSDRSLANPMFSWDLPGEYTFQLQVNDGVLASTPDVATFTFNNTLDNNAPVANAGADMTISNTTECSTASYTFTCEDCPADDVTLDGSASDDPVDGDELNFLWSESTGELTIEQRFSPITRAIAPSAPSERNVTTTRQWEVELAVSDCADTDVDSVLVTYTCTGEYSP